MYFNVDECKVMYIGDKDADFKYLMRNEEVSNIIHEIGLRVIIGSNLKMRRRRRRRSRRAKFKLIWLHIITKTQYTKKYEIEH